MAVPKISVILPVYNVEKYLRRCLDCLQNQTLTDFEIIAVNDGSPDNSIDILNEYAAKDSRIKVITQKNGGLSSARNTGTKNANGEYIYFLDSDDYIHFQTLEIAYNLAVQNNSDIVSFKKNTGLRTKILIKEFFGINGNNTRPKNLNKKYDLSKIESYTTNDIFSVVTERGSKQKFEIRHCYVWQNLYRRELISDIPFTPGIIMEDAAWWPLLWLRHPKTTIINLPLYYYIPQINSIMASSKVLRKIDNLIYGIKYIFDVYKMQAKKSEMNVWQSKFMWPFLHYGFGKVSKLKDELDIIEAKKLFSSIAEIGVLENPCEPKNKKLKNKILEFIK